MLPNYGTYFEIIPTKAGSKYVILEHIHILPTMAANSNVQYIGIDFEIPNNGRNNEVSMMAHLLIAQKMV